MQVIAITSVLVILLSTGTFLFNLYLEDNNDYETAAKEFSEQYGDYSKLPVLDK